MTPVYVLYQKKKFKASDRGRYTIAAISRKGYKYNVSIGYTLKKQIKKKQKERKSK